MLHVGGVFVLEPEYDLTTPLVIVQELTVGFTNVTVTFPVAGIVLPAALTRVAFTVAVMASAAKSEKLTDAPVGLEGTAVNWLLVACGL